MMDRNDNKKSIEPLALLVHPQQPLSYLERLIQSELPTIKGKDGKEKVPDVWFRAEDNVRGELEESSRDEGLDSNMAEEGEEGSEEMRVDGKIVKVGKVKTENENKGNGESVKAGLRGGPGEGGVEIYSGKGREASTPSSSSPDRKFVRWSSSTEIGDFIRDAV